MSYYYFFAQLFIYNLIYLARVSLWGAHNDTLAIYYLIYSLIINKTMINTGNGDGTTELYASRGNIAIIERPLLLSRLVDLKTGRVHLHERLLNDGSVLALPHLDGHHRDQGHSTWLPL